MAENTEIDDRVDLDDDNYSEEDEDVEEPVEDDGSGDGGEENEDEPQEEARSEDRGKEQSPTTKKSDIRSHLNDEKFASMSDEEKAKHAELLSLPPHGSEVFIGGLCRDVSEEDLRELCEPFGEILEIRIVKNRDTGESKGFAFVSFRTQDVAQKTIEALHSKDFKGRTLRCSLSETKYRLFIGNVPKAWTDDDFRKIIEATGPGAEIIELIKDPQDPTRNRGFAFVEYYNNACADYSRQKMLVPSFKLDGNTPTVTWADPKITPNHSAAAASQVKALYVKNIPENTSTEQLKELFQRHGEVTKVVMPPAKSGGKRDFGFLHYAERSSALKAINETEEYEINGQLLEVVLAKPQTEKRFDSASPLNPQMPNYSHPGCAGIPLSPFAPMSAGYGAAAAGFQQPMIYGRGPMPTGMQMVPMLLPDGRIGYVLQQPGAQIPLPARPRRNDRGNGGGPTQGRGGASSSGDDSSSRNKRYRPY